MESNFKSMLDMIELNISFFFECTHRDKTLHSCWVPSEYTLDHIILKAIFYIVYGKCIANVSPFVTSGAIRN